MQNRLIELLHPKDIYLFGSYAKGTATTDSDVILPEGAETKRSMLVDARRAVKDIFYSRDLAFDLLLTSWESFERYKPYPGTIQHEAASHGISIFD